jgi:hypothetical protein
MQVRLRFIARCARCAFRVGDVASIVRKSVLTPLSWAPATQVRNFYAVWSGFSTEKGFEWVEQWDAERGDVRHVRR